MTIQFHSGERQQFESEQARLEYLRQQLVDYEKALAEIEPLLAERETAVTAAQAEYDRARETLRQVLVERARLVARFSRDSDAYSFSNSGATLSDQDRSSLHDYDDAEEGAREGKHQASRALEDAFAARADVAGRRDNYRWAILNIQSAIGTSERLIAERAATVKRVDNGLLERIRATVMQHASTA